VSSCKNLTRLDMQHSVKSNREKGKNFPSLPPLVASGAMKTATAENVASSGLNLKHLLTMFNRNGEDSLYNIFTVKNSEGLPRVTSVKLTLESFIPKLAAYFENKKAVFIYCSMMQIVSKVCQVIIKLKFSVKLNLCTVATKKIRIYRQVEP